MYIHRLKLCLVSIAVNTLLEARIAVGMGIPMGIPIPMGMGWEGDRNSTSTATLQKAFTSRFFNYFGRLEYNYSY